MAKTKRVRLGSVVRGQDGKPDYIKVHIKDKEGKPSNYVLRDGQYLNLESKAKQQADLEFLVKNEKIDEKTAKYLKEKIEKIPEFVRFEVVAVEDK
jgi:hypothetical protein